MMNGLFAGLLTLLPVAPTPMPPPVAPSLQVRQPVRDRLRRG